MKGILRYVLVLNVMVLSWSDCAGAGPFFQGRVDYPAVQEPFAIAIGDVNNDSHADLVVSSFYSPGLSVYFGVGDGTFQPQIFSSGWGSGYNIGLGNFNGDEWVDAVTPDEGGIYALLYTGAGTGSFSPPYRLDTPGPSPSHLVLADVNEDTKLDIAVTNWGNPGSVSIHLGNGDGTFGSGVAYGTAPGPRGIAIGDVDGDGHLDLVVAIEGVTGLGLGLVSVLSGHGDGTFAAKTDYGATFMSVGVALGDVNGDQKLDVATTGWDGKVAVLLNAGNGAFGSKTEYSAGGWHFSVALADIDGDGNNDIIVPDAGFYNDVGRLGVLRGLGNGTFEQAVFQDTWFGATGVSTADLNEDGRIDVAVATQGNLDTQEDYISVLLNCSPCTPTAIEVALLEVRSDESGVHIRWNVHEPDGSTATLERRTRSEEWAIRAQLLITGSLLEANDPEVSPGERYAYRLVIHSPEGEITTPEFWVDAAGSALPHALVLSQPSPNPSGGTISMRLGLPREGSADLAVFDVSGRLVARVANSRRVAGWHDLSWDGRDQAGRPVASGTYFLRLTAGSSVTRRFVVLR